MLTELIWTLYAKTPLKTRIIALLLSFTSLDLYMIFNVDGRAQTYFVISFFTLIVLILTGILVNKKVNSIFDSLLQINRVGKITGGTILVWLSFFLAACRFSYLMLNPKSIKCEKLNLVTGQISNRPEYVKRNYGSNSIDFKLNSYPEITFSASSYAPILESEFIKSDVFGSNVELMISELSNPTVVYAIRNLENRQQYLSCSQHNENWRSTDKSYVYLVVLMSFSLLAVAKV